MNRNKIYEKISTKNLIELSEDKFGEVLEYLPLNKHKTLNDLLEIERELTFREE